MHWVVEQIRNTAKKEPKIIVFPEINDERIVEASKIVDQQGIAKSILLDDSVMTEDKKQKYAHLYYEKRKHKHKSVDEVLPLMDDRLYFGNMMVKAGDADGIVSGAEYTSGAVAKSTFRCFDVDPRSGIITSCFLMALEDESLGERGIYIYADCGIIPYPNSEQLAGIAIASANFAKEVLKFEPKVACLSFSSKGSAKSDQIDRVIQAVDIVKKKDPTLVIDGELQVDSAIVPSIAKNKVPDSEIAGNANVLIFPNLDAGNIAYKLTERLAKARALGPLLLGTVQPCSDLSRGCSVDDIIDCVAITVIKAQRLKEGYRG